MNEAMSDRNPRYRGAMTDESELQDPASWMMDEAVSMDPVQFPRSVVSVSFGSDDLTAFVEAARANGVKTSEFIRTGAIREPTRKQRRFSESEYGSQR